MADLDFSAESSALWEQMQETLLESIGSSSNEKVAVILDKMNNLIEQAIIEIEQEQEIYGKISSGQFFSKKFDENIPELLMQQQQKNLGQYTALQKGYMFLDEAYAIITGNKTEFMITATGADGESFFAKQYSLEQILMQTHTIKEGNFLLKSAMQMLQNEIQQESNRVALEGNTLKVYQTFYSLTQNKKAKGFTEGHLSEAIQRYLQDTQEGKPISKESLMKNITDSLQNSAFYEEGDLSRVDSAELETTIETQLKNIGNNKYGFITIGSTSTIINGLKKLQNILSNSVGLIGPELQTKLKKEMFSQGAPPRKINESLKREAEKAIEELLSKIMGNSS